MPAYKDDKHGTWYAAFYYPDWTGKRKKKFIRGFKTKKEASEAERLFLLQAAADMDMPLKSFVEIYFKDKDGELKERTKYNKRKMIEAHVIPYFGERKMNEILPADVITWQNEIRKLGYEDTYLRMIQNQLTALFNHATKIYGLKSNPCHKVKKMGKSDAVGIEFWTYDEYKEFRKTLEPGSKYYVLFQILFFTGIRIGELLALTIEDFDFSNNTLSITKTFYRLKGKPTITAPKTENSVRTIDIPSSLANEVKEYYEKLYQYPEDERIFDISHEAVQHKMARNTEKAGIKKIRVHDLRHSAVAFLIHKGVQPEIIKERMGHKDITITLNTYGHLYPSAQKKVAEMLDEVNRASDENEGSDE